MQKKTRLPEAPGHLRPETQVWWDAVVAEYDLEPSDLRILEAAGAAWDRAAAACEVIAKNEHGILHQDRFKQWKEHPAVATERDSTRVFLAALRQLGIGLEGPSDDATRLPDPTAARCREDY